MANLQINENYYGFKLIEEKYIEELQAKARVFKHQKSGANFIQVESSDVHKAFTITFKTPPTNNTGVAHIIEHAVCCASEKYPLKDTFIEIDKGSVNTGLNACTYKDMTMYYCSTRHSLDLENLVHVLVDLVFKPLIYTRPYIFKQEGWHYVLEDEKAPISYNGIVYNEMQGEYSEAAAYLEYEIHKQLFPDTVYQYDSGGIPDEIVKLTEEEFLKFHRKYYQPSNCVVYLYGDEDVLKYLKFLDDEYFKNYTKSSEVFTIPYQKPFDKKKDIILKYPATQDNDTGEGTILNLSFVVGDGQDTLQRLAFQIIEHMLLKSAASPLSKALVEQQKIGKLVEESGYDVGKQQPTFSITLRGAKANGKSDFERIVFEVLQEMVTNGINKDLLQAAIHTVTFGLHEAEDQSEAKGVLYCEDILQSYLYGKEAFSHLSYSRHLETINVRKSEGYFEELIKTYFIDNKHSVCITLEPDYKGEKLRARNISKVLEHYKKSLTLDEKNRLIAMNEVLDEIQDTPNTEEELAVLPVLTKSDIKSDVEEINRIEDEVDGIKVLYSEADTREIVYMHILFDTQGVQQEDISYVGILASFLTYISTKTYSYDVLENQINQITGGLNCSINAYGDCEDTNSYRPLFKMSMKYLASNTSEVMTLLESICKETVFNERDKMKEIIGYIKYEMERSFASTPEYRAIRRLYSYFSDAAVYEDLTSGINFYYFITDLYEHFDEKFELLAHKLKMIYERILTKNNLLVSIMTEKKYYKQVVKNFTGFANKLSNNTVTCTPYSLVKPQKNEAYTIGSSVQAVAMGCNFKNYGYTFKGSINVVANLLESTYLWDKIRLQGGAYGSQLAISRDGNMMLCSYCDPRLKETLEVYNNIGEFLKKVKVSDRELLKYIIGTIGGLDYPLTNEQQSERNLVYYLCNITHELLQKEREEVLATTQKDIWAIGEFFDLLAKDNVYCVIGNTKKIKQNKKLFNMIETCLQ